MNRDMLRQIFLQAEENKLDVAIELTLPDAKEAEIIIVKNRNLKYKLEYYESAYDEELKHMLNPNIRMINAYVIDYVPNYMQFQ